MLPGVIEVEWFFPKTENNITQQKEDCVLGGRIKSVISQWCNFSNIHLSSKCSPKLADFNIYKSDLHQSHFDKNHWLWNSLVVQWLGYCAFTACHGFDSWLGNFWRRKWQPIPVFLPEKSHGQKSLVNYSPWGRRVGHDWMTSLGELRLHKLHREKKKKCHWPTTFCSYSKIFLR